MQGKIEIGIIPQDLRQEETIVQIAEALDTLNSAVSNIFGCIDERLSKNTERLAGIRNRAVKLQGKLDHLQNNLSLKAVKLYSAAKYPSNHVYWEYSMAVKLPFDRDEKPPTVYKSSALIEQRSRLQGIIGDKTKSGRRNGDVNIQEKLQFYHVRSRAKYRSCGTDSSTLAIKPSSVSSLLLNDDGDSQYRKQPAKILPTANDKREIEDAPTSILQSWHPTELESPSNYFYAPTLGEVPLINVPLTLPDLPGVVDDERFVLDLNGQSPIAPSSVVTTPTINLGLPATQAISVTDTSPGAQNRVENDPTLANLSLPSVSSEHNVVTPPPFPVELGASSQPGPPPPPLPQISPTLAAQPPPPPPPPPEFKEATPDGKETKKQSVKVPPKLEEAVDRSSLMAAIRNAGGVGRAKLKRAKPKEEKPDKWSSASVGGDLMADLHSKLSLRRKGISGTVTDALDRISAMIPPPPKPNDSVTSERNSATSEQDSQPDTDWEE